MGESSFSEKHPLVAILLFFLVVLVIVESGMIMFATIQLAHISGSNRAIESKLDSLIVDSRNRDASMDSLIKKGPQSTDVRLDEYMRGK